MRFAGANKAVDAIGVAVVDQHAHGGIRVERIARLPAFGLLFKEIEKPVGNALLKQQAGSGDTDLALVVKDTAGGSVNRFLQIRTVGKNDIGAFTARLQPDAFHIAVACVLQQLFTRAGRTGKSNHFDVRMPRQRLTGFMAETAHYVAHAVWQSGLFR